MHTYIIYFRGFVVGSQSLLTWGFCPGSSRAPTSLCRRPRTGQFWSAAAARRHNWRRRQRRGAARRPKKIPKNFVLSSKFSEDLFTHRKLQQNKYIATIASAVRPQIIGGGQQISSKIPEKISFYRNNFLM